MLFTHNELFNDDFVVFFFAQSNLKSSMNFSLRFQIKGDTTAMVGVNRFEHHGQADVLRHRPGLLCCGHSTAFGHRYAALREQTLGEVFVAGNMFCNRTGFVCLSGPNTPLTRAITQLHQITRSEADRRNASLSGCVHNASRAGSQTQAVYHVFEFFYRGLGVKRFVVDGRHDQVTGVNQTFQTNFFLPCPENHFVDAAGTGFSGLTKTHLHTRQGLQLDGHMLDDVSRPCAISQTPNETTHLAHTAMVLLQTG